MCSLPSLAILPLSGCSLIRCTQRQHRTNQVRHHSRYLLTPQPRHIPFRLPPPQSPPVAHPPPCHLALPSQTAVPPHRLQQCRPSPIPHPSPPAPAPLASRHQTPAAPCPPPSASFAHRPAQTPPLAECS